MNMPRFLKEYANFQKSNILKNELMKGTRKREKVETIEKVLKKAEYGYITINEAIRLINEE